MASHHFPHLDVRGNRNASAEMGNALGFSQIVGNNMARHEATDLEKSIGKSLMHYRLSIGMTRPELAGLLGLSQQQICKYENGTNRISISMFLKFCQAIGVDYKKVLDERLLPEVLINKQRRHLTEFFQAIASLSPRSMHLLKSYVKALVSGV